MTVWLILLIAGGILLIAGIAAIATAPLTATRVASRTSRPRLERRASGPDRMRALITAQRTERTKKVGIATTLTRTGYALSGLAALALVGGIGTWFAGVDWILEIPGLEVPATPMPATTIPATPVPATPIPPTPVPPTPIPPTEVPATAIPAPAAIAVGVAV